LDIGTGSGYQAAVLSLLAKEVISIEIISELAEKAKINLQKLGFENIKVFLSDGSLGLPRDSPFDAIVCAAAGDKVPKTWKEQLKEGGRIVMPVNRVFGQELIRVTKKGGVFIEENVCPVAFVPLVTK